MRAAKTLIRPVGYPDWSEAGRTGHFVGFVMRWHILFRLNDAYDKISNIKDTMYQDCLWSASPETNNCDCKCNKLLVCRKGGALSLWSWVRNRFYGSYAHDLISVKRRHCTLTLCHLGLIVVCLNASHRSDTKNFSFIIDFIFVILIDVQLPVK